MLFFSLFRVFRAAVFLFLGLALARHHLGVQLHLHVRGNGRISAVCYLDVAFASAEALADPQPRNPPQDPHDDDPVNVLMDSDDMDGIDSSLFRSSD